MKGGKITYELNVEVLFLFDTILSIKKRQLASKQVGRYAFYSLKTDSRYLSIKRRSKTFQGLLFCPDHTFKCEQVYRYVLMQCNFKPINQTYYFHGGFCLFIGFVFISLFFFLTFPHLSFVLFPASKQPARQPISYQGRRCNILHRLDRHWLACNTYSRFIRRIFCGKTKTLLSHA